jgi:hypothetical protein
MKIYAHKLQDTSHHDASGYPDTIFLNLYMLNSPYTAVTWTSVTGTILLEFTAGS